MAATLSIPILPEIDAEAQTTPLSVKLRTSDAYDVVPHPNHRQSSTQALSEASPPARRLKLP